MRKNTCIKRSLRTSCILVLLICPSFSHASALLDLLEVLRDNGTINQQAYEALKEAAVEESKQRGDAVAAQTKDSKPEASRPDAPVLQTKHGEQAKTPVKVNLGGRILVDAASYQNTGDVDFGSGAELRRVRGKVFGTVYDDWYFRTSTEFTDDVDLKSTYLEYRGWESNTLTIGKFKEPIALEELNSSNHTTFMERAMLTELHPGRNVGPAWTYFDSPLRVRFGLFAQDVEGATNGDDALAIGGRAVFAPVQDKYHLLHFGVAANYRDLPSGSELRFRSRPESHVTSIRLIDTEPIANVDRQTLLGAEAAWVHGPVSLQGEYLQTTLTRETGPDLRFAGWYTYLSWFLTGESRRYQAKRGVFGRITPKQRMGAGGIGAWELALRYSRLDLTDEDVVGGIEENLTLGLSWYLNRYVRFMANYVKVMELDRPGSQLHGVEPDIFQLRSQINF